MSDHSSPSPVDLSRRALALLRAAHAGRVELALSCEPDMFVDGVAVTDQWTAHGLAHAGLVRPACPGRIGDLVAAELTSTGYAIMERAERDRRCLAA
ncbi:hypothetical protein [Nocardia arthritidis]|uniref:hypothetical protein n=1 Tax=Nocardia arthritidis TaxID=228602 RepID=UPI0007A3E2E5|nr:hypothetical protein [Nocardia arthritidis]